MIDFTIPAAVQALQERTAAFIRETVIPAEPRDLGAHGLDPALRDELQAGLARGRASSRRRSRPSSAGTASTMRGAAVILEEAGYSLLGPQALNCAAPDEGNMHLLYVVATPAQRERYLRAARRRRRSAPASR